jgi:signal transduction histidine kinase/response regulator RpfG family c-di-GMP phosphodiesterase
VCVDARVAFPTLAMKFQIDRVVARCMLACVVAAALMLVNRWVVATEQASVLAKVLTDNARVIAGHVGVEHQGTPTANRRLHESLHETLSLSEHHLAAAWVSAAGALAGEARDASKPVPAFLLAPAGRSMNGSHFDPHGQPARIHQWAMLPETVVVEQDAGGGERLRVLVSLKLARDNQWSIFLQAIISVAIAVLLVLVVVLLILRRPRRVLNQASEFAAQLPYQTVEPLQDGDAGLAAINRLRDSLNAVSRVLERQRLQHNVDEHRLQQAAIAAQAATDAKGAFLAHMSHEVRTPLNAVMGLTRLVLDTPLAEPQRQHLMTVHQSANNLLQIVNKVLDLSRMDAGKLELESAPFPLYTLLDEALKPFALQASEKGIELITAVCPNLPLTVIGDPLRLRQVLTNLVGNAIKFTTEGHVRVHVVGTAPYASLANAQTASIAFKVTDTGPGIAPEHRARILEPFAQADASTARQHGGSGLGLSITHQLLDLMGAPLTVESQPGSGSTFGFVVTLGLPPLPHSGHTTRYRSLPGRRVLWVDTSGKSVDWHRHVFAMWSVELDHAHNLDEAGTCLQQKTYDAIFFDAAACRVATRASLLALLSRRRQARLCLQLAPTDMVPDALKNATAGLVVLMRPVSPMELHEAVAGDNLQRRGADAAARLDGLRVLVVDDNEVNRIVAGATLESLGASVAMAHDGLHALVQIARLDLDVVLMDLQMPHVDGYEATRRLRERERALGRARLPVIALTAFGPDDDNTHIRDAGMDGYIGKPIEIVSLVYEVRAVLARTAGQGAVSESAPVLAPSPVPQAAPPSAASAA